MSAVIALVALLLASQQIDDSGTPELQEDLFHSDLPLWADDQDHMWPRAFQDAQSFGCATKIRYGNWRLDSAERDMEPRWYRWTNYGAMHCFMWSGGPTTKNALPKTSAEPSFLIDLGALPGSNDAIELWALQQGSRPGSNYILLSRTRQPGIITSFDVLQRGCPPENLRKGPQLDILKTSYCVFNSRAALIDTARRMARRPPLGRLTWQSKAKGGD
ncbi:hypothetical protein ACSBM8_14280 [Sphingomonas sp. ASY06-1R]|uniref:hypothetical protein n=1 Tax=Sphingomonas sp. ASY06-1R TaxID=3445771 RepID=UPI003FA26037